MTMHDGLTALCVVFAIGIIIKGFRGSTRVKPIDRPDNWQNDTPPKDD